MKGITTYLRRPLSFAAAMTMILANMFGTVTAMAEEETSETVYYDDTGPEELVPETGETTYNVSLPWIEGCLYTYDQTHQMLPKEEMEEEKEKQDIILNYRKDEEVRIGILTADQFDVAELHLFNSQDETKDRKEPVYTWDEQKGELEFFMPEEDLFLELKIAEHTMEPQTETALQEQDIVNENEMQDVSNITENSVSDFTDHPETESEEPMSSNGTEAVTETEESQAYEMVLEMDGLPTQGSIIQMETMTIPYDTWDFNPETDFTNITFSTEENEITYISDDIDYVKPGVYSSIYRIQQKNTERMWYVLRPVRVLEQTAETKTSDEPDSDRETEPSTETSSQETEAETETEIETETGAETETESESETEITGPSFDLYIVNADDENEKLEGAVFRLSSSTDQETESTEETQVTGSSMSGTEFKTDQEGHYHQDNLIPGTTYFLYEISTLPGFNLDTNKYEFQVDEQGLIDGNANYTLTLKNQPNHVEISKKSSSGELLVGAQMEIRSVGEDGKEKVMESWTTDENVHQISKLPAGNYTLNEISAPKGYALAPEMSFNVANSLETQEITMVDDPLIKVVISKKDLVTDEMLSGAKLVIEDQDKKAVEKWTSKEEARECYLEPGEYTLTETSAPKGYEVAETVIFEVQDARDEQTIVLYDEPKDELVNLIGKKKEVTSNGNAQGTGSMMQNGSGSNYVSSPVKTGDDTDFLVPVLLMLLSGGTIGVLIVRRRKKQNLS